MILEELTIKGFRSFCEGELLKLEPDVTVLTGGNDVGKTAVLHLIRMLCRNEQGIEGDANYTVRRRAKEPIDQSRDYDIAAKFIISKPGWRYINSSFDPGTSIALVYAPNLKLREVTNVKSSDGGRISRTGGFEIKELPTVLDLAGDEEIRTKVSEEELNPSEERLLAHAFGPRFKELLNEYSEEAFESEVRGGLRSLNLKLRDALPESLRISFEMKVQKNESLSFVIGVSDEFGGDTPFALRGSGARKLLRLMASLLDTDLTAEHVIIVVDEPENSLHPDGQHSLRRILEELGALSTVQVVYATHSPSMINAARPWSIRLLSRERSDKGNPTTWVNNKPYANGNFQLIRSSLGMTPTDSLLYAPITIIIEGATESLGLNRVFKRLITEGDKDKYRDLEGLLGQVHFLPAGGSKYDRWAKMAHSQGAKPIVFVDGDQISRVKALRRDYPDISIIHFRETMEIEDIVPREVYFEALADYAASNNPASSKVVSMEAYEKWAAQQCIHDKVLFSKRVAKWYEKTFEYDIEKAEVMDSAIKRAKFEDIDMRKIDELIDAIREAAESLR